MSKNIKNKLIKHDAMNKLNNLNPKLMTQLANICFRYNVIIRNIEKVADILGTIEASDATTKKKIFFFEHFVKNTVSRAEATQEKFNRQVPAEIKNIIIEEMVSLLEYTVSGGCSTECWDIFEESLIEYANGKSIEKLIYTYQPMEFVDGAYERLYSTIAGKVINRQDLSLVKVPSFGRSFFVES